MHEYQPRIVAFACNWCSYAGADLAGVSRIQYPPTTRVIRVMCSGRVSPMFILEALRSGADGVLVTGCHLGDCHYISGNVQAEEIITRLKRVVHILGLEEERLKLKWISTSEGVIFARTIAETVDELKKLGPSPFRKETMACR